MRTWTETTSASLTRRQATWSLCVAGGTLVLGSGCAVQSEDEAVSSSQAELTVSNIDQLRGIQGRNGMLVHVLGFETAGDGGGGLFAFKPGAQTAADDVGYLIRASGVGWWQRQLSTKDVSVKWFGAKGDGVHNDVAAVSAAAQVALQLDGRLFVPDGVYNVRGIGTQVNLGTLPLAAPADSSPKLVEFVPETGLTLSHYPSSLS